MEQEKHYRHELKYVIPYAEYLAVRQRLRTVMSVDPHVSKSGLYQTRSVYFDNSDDKALREKIDGIGKREKRKNRCHNRGRQARNRRNWQDQAGTGRKHVKKWAAL